MCTFAEHPFSVPDLAAGIVRNGWGGASAHNAFVARFRNNGDVFAPDDPALPGPQQPAALRRNR